MNLCLDTNVLVSGMFFSGAPADLLVAATEAKYTPVLTQLILDEYTRIADEMSEKLPHRRRSHHARAFLEQFTSRSEFLADVPVVPQLCRDPHDDKFLACAALSGGIVVSGDRDLLSGTPWELFQHRVEVVTPRQALGLLAMDSRE